MSPSAPRPVRVRDLLLALACGDLPTRTLRNDVVEAGFVGPRPGLETELAWLKDVATGRRIDFLTHARDGLRDEEGRALRSGSLSLLLRDRERPFAVADRDRVRWLAPAAEEGATVVEADVDRLAIEQTVPDLAFDGERFLLRTRIEWRLAPGSRFLEGRFEIEIPGMGRGGDAAGRAFYASAIRFPRLFVRQLDAAEREPAPHALVLPNQMGFLLRDALREGNRLPSFFAGPDDAREFNLRRATIPLLAYYDERTRSCLYLSDDERGEWWRDYEAARHASPAGPFLELRCRHLPDDLYAKDGFAPRYRTRIAAIEGDWLDVADFERGLLAQADARFARPFGARDDVGPALRDAPLEVRVSTVERGGDPDDLLLDVRDLRRIGGDGALVVWNGGYWPDTFDDFFHRGWLPGRPSLPAAIAAAQRDGRACVAPYVNTFFGVDGRTENVGATAQTAATAGHALLRERGTEHRVGTGKSRFPDIGACQGESETAPGSWGELLETTLVDVLERTRARALYLDMFHTAPCFSVDPRHRHAPGGGDYMHLGRLRQLRAVRAAAKARGLPFEGFACEALHLGFVGDVDVMHAAPLHASFDDDGDAAVRAPALRSIPFFRVVADAVRIGQFEQSDAQAEPSGARAWQLATEVIAFGLMPHRMNEAVDRAPTIGGEYDRLYHDGADEARYVARLVRLMGDARSGFLRFHQGTLRRAPAFRVGGSEAFLGERWGRAGRVPPLPAEALVVGLFAAPLRPGDATREAALVVTNPWIDGRAPSLTFDDVVVEPASWGLAPTRPCTVVEIDDDGGVRNERTLPAGVPFRIEGRGPAIAPGTVRQWRFRG